MSSGARRSHVVDDVQAVDGMHAVVVRHDARASVADDGWVRERADAIGMTLYELRTRLRVLDGWPGILATYAEESAARAVAAALVRAGLEAWVLSGRSIEPRAVARCFSRVGGALRVELDDHHLLEVPTSDVRMLVRGVALGEQRLPGVPAGVSPLARSLRWTGLGSAMATTPARGRVRLVQEPFVELYALRGPIVSFRAARLRYAALDGGQLAPTRVANFQRAVQMLRAACPAAVYDDRLCGRLEQMRLLGPTLRPQTHLGLALALVAGARASVSPYR